MLLLWLLVKCVSALDKIHSAGVCVARLYVMLMIHTALKWNVRLIIYLNDELPYLGCKECVEEEILCYQSKAVPALQFPPLRLSDRLRVYLSLLRFYV